LCLRSEGLGRQRFDGLLNRLSDGLRNVLDCEQTVAHGALIPVRDPAAGTSF